MIKHIINTFIVIAACLGIAAFILVLVREQNCQSKENYKENPCGNCHPHCACVSSLDKKTFKSQYYCKCEGSLAYMV